MGKPAKPPELGADQGSIHLRTEIEGLYECLVRGDKQASVHLARLLEYDTRGALQPFAEALSARLSDHLNRYAELGITDPNRTLEDEVYGLLKNTAIDWNGLRRTGRPGEEA